MQAALHRGVQLRVVLHGLLERGSGLHASLADSCAWLTSVTSVTKIASSTERHMFRTRCVIGRERLLGVRGADGLVGEHAPELRQHLGRNIVVIRDHHDGGLGRLDVPG